MKAFTHSFSIQVRGGNASRPHVLRPPTDTDGVYSNQPVRSLSPSTYSDRVGGIFLASHRPVMRDTTSNPHKTRHRRADKINNQHSVTVARKITDPPQRANKQQQVKDAIGVLCVFYFCDHSSLMWHDSTTHANNRDFKEIAPGWAHSRDGFGAVGHIQNAKFFCLLRQFRNSVAVAVSGVLRGSVCLAHITLCRLLSQRFRMEMCVLCLQYGWNSICTRAVFCYEVMRKRTFTLLCLCGFWVTTVSGKVMSS